MLNIDIFIACLNSISRQFSKCLPIYQAHLKIDFPFSPYALLDGFIALIDVGLIML